MKPIFIDLETGDAEHLYTYGPGYCRLAGYAYADGPVTVTTDMDELVAAIEGADLVYAHNGLAFDLPALELYHGLDLAKLVDEGRVCDTLLMARHADPPLPGNQDGRRYGLDAVGKRLLGEGKCSSDGESVLKRLAREHGGFDKIPVDDPEYRDYLIQDVELLRDVARRLPFDHYLLREHRALWRLNHITKNGWLVDRPALERFTAAQRERAGALLLQMHQKYGLPLSSALAERLGMPLPDKEIKSPAATTAGKAAIRKALIDCGVEPPLTEKGNLATDKKALAKLRDENPDNGPLLELVDALGALVGERSVAQTILNHTRSDGRIHPDVSARQNTGRFSVTKPGLTVMGKRDRANLPERAFLLPDPGHLLLCVDLSQIDARAMAAHSQDPNYIAAFEPGKDLHSEMAATLFGDCGWDRTSGEHHPRRSDAKPVTHATSYGMGAGGLANYAGMEKIEAEGLLRELDAKFPGLAAFKEDARVKAKTQGLIYNAFGRPIRIQPTKEYTTGPAAYGQGTARDLLVEGILRLPVELLPYLRGVVHDELVFSIPEVAMETAKSLILNAMQFWFTPPGGEIAVPVLAEASESGKDWMDCYRSDYTYWPEVAWDHRQLPSCDDEGCTWHQ